jgi:hypothetical protein
MYAVLAQPWWSKVKPSHNYHGKLSYLHGKQEPLLKILRSHTNQYSKLLSREYLFPSLVVELVVNLSTLGVPLRRVVPLPRDGRYMQSTVTNMYTLYLYHTTCVVSSISISSEFHPKLIFELNHNFLVVRQIPRTCPWPYPFLTFYAFPCIPIQYSSAHVMRNAIP